MKSTEGVNIGEFLAQLGKRRVELEDVTFSIGQKGNREALVFALTHGQPQMRFSQPRLKGPRSERKRSKGKHKDHPATRLAMQQRRKKFEKQLAKDIIREAERQEFRNKLLGEEE